VIREGARVAGVRYRTRADEEGEIRARLVVGADGRRSGIAEAVGARPWITCPNDRIMFYAYATDPHPAWRRTAAQWREGRELGTVFPCDGESEGDPLTLVLLMPPADRAPEFKQDPEGAWERTIAAIPPMAERLEGSRRVTKLRSSREHPSFFRHSTGPGWALAGDAGHFKDPVTAQGIRDALRFGRLLGEAVAPALDDPARLDAALHGWERNRDRECFDMYQWSNLLGRADAVSPLELEAYRELAACPREVLDVFSRVRAPGDVFTPRRGAVWAARALRRGSVPRGAVLRTAARDARRRAAARRERGRARAAV
jgi:2-polyprenyl-6-methoxyphenol hydroxylase-like FAD-dependent oxidoreductase